LQCVELEIQGGLGIVSKAELALAPGNRQWLVGLDANAELALLSREVLQVERKHGLVARSHDAWRTDLRDQVGAHDRFRIAAAVLVRTEDQRADPQGSVEVRHLQLDARIALRIER